MTTLCVSARFITRGVWVHPELCGRVLSWQEDGRQVRLTLPSTVEDFHLDRESETVRFPALSSTATVQSSGEAVSVDLIRIEVDIDVEVNHSTWRAARDSEDESQLDALRSIVEPAWHVGHSTGERAVQRWLTHMRTLGTQPWLGLTAEELVQHGRSYIYEGTIVDGTLMAFGPQQSLTIRSAAVAVSTDAMDDIITKLTAGQDPAIADVLLGEALFLTQEAETIDSQRAILSAATACEVRIKEALRAHALPAELPLLNLALGGQSSISKLLDAPYAAIFGRPLAQEDGNLYQKLRRLTVLRNDVVHKGDPVERDEGRALVIAAQMLFALLAGKVRP